MPIAANPETGEVLFFDGDKWTPAYKAFNPETNEVVAFDGEKWHNVGIRHCKENYGSAISRGYRQQPAAVARCFCRRKLRARNPPERPCQCRECRQRYLSNCSASNSGR
jgi:hypothetical protein